MIAVERVYLALGWEPERAVSIALRLGCPASTVSWAMRDLIAEGRAVETSRGYARRPEPAPRIADLTPADWRETIGDFSFAAGGAF